MRSATNNLNLFNTELPAEKEQKDNTREELTRLDLNGELKKKILPFCRLKYGEIWEDPIKGHKVGVLDATKLDDIKKY